MDRYCHQMESEITRWEIQMYQLSYVEDSCCDSSEEVLWSMTPIQWLIYRQPEFEAGGTGSPLIHQMSGWVRHKFICINKCIWFWKANIMWTKSFAFYSTRRANGLVAPVNANKQWQVHSHISPPHLTAACYLTSAVLAGWSHLHWQMHFGARVYVNDLIPPVDVNEQWQVHFHISSPHHKLV